MINVCLVGCGRMGQAHAKHIHQSPLANLYCVVDPIEKNAQKIAHETGAKVYPDFATALNDMSVDAVVIVSSTSTHADLICAAARAKKPIFCEKPIDLDLKRIDQCLSVVNESQVPLFVGFNRRFDLSFRTLHNNIREGKIGSLEFLIISSRDAPFPDLAYLKTSGGMFKDMAIHDFDMARWLLNEEPTEVYAQGSCLIDKRVGEFGDIDTAMIVLKTKSGRHCHINNSRRCVYGYDQRIEAYGSKGMLRAHNMTPTCLEFSNEEGIHTDIPHPSFPQRYNEAYRFELESFFNDVVKNKKSPEISGEDGRQALVIAEAANLSLEKGIPVKIPLPKEHISKAISQKTIGAFL